MKTLLAGAQILKQEKIVQMSSAITLFVSSAQAIVICPSCQTVTGKVHSRYERAAAGLPWEGIPVRLRLQVRKFFAASGADVVKIRELMGHASTTTTMRYMHAIDSGKRDAIARMAARYAQNDCHKIVTNEKRQVPDLP